MPRGYVLIVDDEKAFRAGRENLDRDISDKAALK